MKTGDEVFAVLAEILRPGSGVWREEITREEAENMIKELLKRLGKPKFVTHETEVEDGSRG